MAVAILHYFSHHYNLLPSIEDAANSLKPTDIVFLTITRGQMFVKLKIQNLLGIALLHNYFPVNNNKIFVNIKSVAVPCKNSNLVEQLCNLQGSVRRFTKQGIAPYKFAYSIFSQPNINNFQPFFSEVRAIFDHSRLTEKLGICLFVGKEVDSTIQMEFT